MKLETTLNDRVLRFDGVSIVEPEVVPELFLRGVQPQSIRVTEVTDAVQQFNSLVEEQDHIKPVSQEPVQIKFDWLIGQDLLEADLAEIIGDAFSEKIKTLNYTEEELLKAAERLAFEIEEIKLRGMEEFFKTVIFVIRTFRSKGIVWGVGRGSSCASYALFILGLHVVDCIKFDVPASEFFHD